MYEFAKALIDRNYAPTACRVALIVGSVLFAINHGAALVKGEMNRNKWLSGLITYAIPYSVNIHGQFTNSQKSIKS